MSLNTHTFRTVLQWSTHALGVLCLMVMTYSFASNNGTIEQEDLTARMLPTQAQREMKWETISAARIASGTTISPNVHTIIYIPDDIEYITRRVLFGRHGDYVRYWGYCFPANYEQALANTRRGFPGKLFLSEAERAARREVLLLQRRRTFSIFDNLNEQDLNESQPQTSSYIRHELERFDGGTTCYVMTEKLIPIGTDADDDSLNVSIERTIGSDPYLKDTDGDGIEDGLEYFRLGSSPILRDSDGDKLIDGIEDKNFNGRVDVDETDPTRWDTDRDGLCDGLCKVNKGQDLRGEDKNLNGIYEPDKGEYNPLLRDSDGNGVLDEHEVFLCVLNGGTDC